MKKLYFLKSCLTLCLAFASALAFAQGGTLDATTFGTGASNFLSAVTIDGNQKILIGGNFSDFGGTSINNFARLNTDGTLESTATFNTGAGPNGVVRSVVIQPSDSKILIGGLFLQYNGVGRTKIARVNTDGSLDVSFALTGTGITGGDVFGIGVQSTGKIVVVGTFVGYNGTTCNRILRLNTDGTLDAAFVTNIGAAANNTINRVVIQSDDKIVLAGAFTSFNGTASAGVARLDADGNLETTFSANIGTGASAAAEALAVQPADGKIILGGQFTTFNGATVGRVVRLNANGTVDGAFSTAAGTAANGTVWTARVLSDGKILLGGSFVQYNGLNRSGLVRLLSTGAADPNFIVGTGFNAQINNIGIQADGKLVVGGAFTTANGATRNRIARVCGELGMASEQTTTLVPTATNQFALGSSECSIVARVEPNGANPVTSNTLSVSVFTDPSVQSFNGTVYAPRHYEINRTAGTGTTGRVTLYFTQADFDAFNGVPNGQDLPTGPGDLSGIANIRITKFDGPSTGGTGEPADYAGGTSIINPNDADIVWNAAASKWEISFNVTGFSGFFLQTSTFVLPVTLKDFTAKAVGDRAELRWVTASEQNSKQFVVERSLNGADFVAIGRVNAAGNSSGDRSYGFNDDLSRLPHNGTVYYRLQMKDVDGTATFSRVATVKSGKVNIGASLLGNPVNGVAKVLFQSVGSDRLTIRVIDSRGQVVMQTNQQIAAGANQFSLNTAGLAKGIYILEIQGSSNDRAALRMIKE